MSYKGKAIADGKGKRKIDDDKTGHRNKKRSGVLQFFEDSAREADDSDDDSLDSLFGDDEDCGNLSLSHSQYHSLLSLSPSFYSIF